MVVELRLYATLRRYTPADVVDGVLAIEVPNDCNVAGVLQKIGLPTQEVHLLMLNGASATFDAKLRSGDRIGVFPPIGGG